MDFEKIQLGYEDRYLIQIPALEDNFIYLLIWNSHALVIDPGDAKKVSSLLAKEHLQLKAILVTHYHSDHVGGNETLKRKTECDIIGPVDERIAGLDQSVDDGEELLFGPFTIEVLSTPGHTNPHVIYFFRDLHLLFSGDLLFGGGCGRIIEGTAEEMWTSLKKVMALPNDTLIYSGHDYTEKNLEFAYQLEPENIDIKLRLEKIIASRKGEKLQPPSTLEEEKKTNPFLRVHLQSIKDAVHLPNGSPLEVFTRLREMKDKA